MDATADKRGNNIISLLRFQYCCAGYCDCFILAGVPVYYQPIMRRRLLPPWDDVKKELGPKGFTEQNYWRGSWWMKDAKVKRQKN